MTAERIGQRSPQRDSAHPKNWSSPFKLKFSIFSQEMPFWHGRDLIPQGPKRGKIEQLVDHVLHEGKSLLAIATSLN